MPGANVDGSLLADFSPDLGDERVVVGFDGYVDRVREIVEGESDPGAARNVRRLGDLGERISAAAEAERSLLMKWDSHEERAGGHVCHVARALGRLGYAPVMLGTFGHPPKALYREEFDGHRLESLGEPAYTDAIEFDDWKFMLTERGELRSLDWATIREQVGFDQLAAYLDGAAALSIGYWAEIGGTTSILEGLANELLPSLSDPPDHLLIDPADIGKRPTAELERGRAALSDLDETVPVTLSANQFETADIANALDSAADRSQMEAAAVARERLGVSRFVTHRATKSVLVSESDRVAVGVPTTDDPVSTTGVGDYFNAGVVLGLIHDRPPHEIVVLGNAIAGYFVRQGDVPTAGDLDTFLSSYSIENWQS